MKPIKDLDPDQEYSPPNVHLLDDPRTVRQKITARIKNMDALQLLSASTQAFVGLLVVALSLTGAIKPIWISSIMTVFGSVSAVVGIYSLFNVFSTRNNFDSLLHSSIKRVIHSQN